MTEKRRSVAVSFRFIRIRIEGSFPCSGFLHEYIFMSFSKQQNGRIADFQFVQSATSSVRYTQMPQASNKKCTISCRHKRWSATKCTEIINTFYPKRMLNFSGLIYFHFSSFHSELLLFCITPTIHSGYISTQSSIRFKEENIFFFSFVF